MNEIKPCPFCGEKPYFTTGNQHNFIGGWMNDLKLECCVTMEEMFGSYESDKSKEEARELLIERWNERNERREVWKELHPFLDKHLPNVYGLLEECEKIVLDK